VSDVRYVVLSDLHFGAKSSILTALAGEAVDSSTPSVVLSHLFDALETITSQNESKELPTLILLGDVLDLALSGQHSSALVFEQFVETVLARETRLFAPDIYYVPGNHDHHLWELVRDQGLHAQVVHSEPGELLRAMPHSSPLGGLDDPDAREGQLLALLIRRHPGCEDISVVTAYPNLGLRAATEDRVAVLHHGHFLEPVYRLISELKGVLFPGQEPPETVHDLECENHAWIDFVWGTLGQSGGVGADITGIYEMFASEEGREMLIARLAGAISQAGSGDASTFRRFSGGFARTVAEHVARSVYARERHETKVSLTPKAQEALMAYLEGPVCAQILADFGGPQPHDLVFVFGHTHKPYVELNLNSIVYESLEVHNTGGWVVDSVADDSLQGAAVVLLDDELQAVSVHCYHETSAADGVRVCGAGSAFLDRVQALVAADAPAWRLLSDAAVAAVDERQVDLVERITDETKKMQERSDDRTPPSTVNH